MSPFSSKTEYNIRHITHDEVRGNRSASATHKVKEYLYSHFIASQSLSTSSSLSFPSASPSTSNDTSTYTPPAKPSYAQHTYQQREKSPKQTLTFVPLPPPSPPPLRRKEGFQNLKHSVPSTSAVAASSGKSPSSTAARPSRFQENFFNSSASPSIDQNLDRLRRQQEDIRAGKYERTVSSREQEMRRTPHHNTVSESAAQKSLNPFASSDRRAVVSEVGSGKRERSASREGKRVGNALKAVSKRVSYGHKNCNDSTLSFACIGENSRAEEEKVSRDVIEKSARELWNERGINGKRKQKLENSDAEQKGRGEVRVQSAGNKRPNPAPVQIIANGGGDLPSDYLVYEPPTPPPKDPGYTPRLRAAARSNAASGKSTSQPPAQSRSQTHPQPKAPRAQGKSSSSSSSPRACRSPAKPPPPTGAAQQNSARVKDQNLTLRSTPAPKIPLIVHPSSQSILSSKSSKHKSHFADVFFTPTAEDIDHISQSQEVFVIPVPQSHNSHT